jgi:hypothetical protein
LVDNGVELERVKPAFFVATEAVAEVLEQRPQLRFVIARHEGNVVPTARLLAPIRARVGLLRAIS